jgi:dienelactone hydrolase
VTYLREWLGDPAKLGAVSPVNLAERIKVPVFLAAGGEDKRAPIQHTERMEAALKRAGTPVESLYYKTEGHGFYTEAHRSEYYDKLLAFLSRSLGGKTATTALRTARARRPDARAADDRSAAPVSARAYFTPCIIFFSSGAAMKAASAQPRPIHISSQNRCA